MSKLMAEYDVEPEEVESDSPIHFSPNSTSHVVVSGRKFMKKEKPMINRDEYLFQ